MQFPPDYALDSDRLLYTAHYTAAVRQDGAAVRPAARRVDRGHPGHDRNTGITFNFNRPDNEPPQAILLVTPGDRERAPGNGTTWSAR